VKAEHAAEIERIKPQAAAASRRLQKSEVRLQK